MPTRWHADTLARARAQHWWTDVHSGTKASSTMFAYAIELRRQLDAAGLTATRIIGPDAFTASAETLCQGMVDDPKLNAAVDAIGVSTVSTSSRALMGVASHPPPLRGWAA